MRSVADKLPTDKLTHRTGHPMPIPDYQTLMLPVLKTAANGETNVTDCVGQLGPALGLSEADLSEMLPSGQQTVFSNRIHWARTYMAKAGLVRATRRGFFEATPRGREVLAENPTRIDNTVLARFPEFVEWRDRSRAIAPRQPNSAATQPPTATDSTPTERIEVAYQEIQDDLQSELLDRVLRLTPALFERLIVDLLVAMGYGGNRADAGRAIGGAGDGGIDGIIKGDPLGLEIVYLQAKRYQRDNSVGRPEVQAFAGSLDGVRATKGVFVTTSTFSSQAREFVDRIAKKIILIDGEELSRLLIEHNVGVRTSNTYQLKKVDEDFFSDE